jgi:hypothetical protein
VSIIVPDAFNRQQPQAATPNALSFILTTRHDQPFVDNGPKFTSISDAGFG